MKRLAAILGLVSSFNFLFLVLVTASQAWISETRYNHLIQRYHEAGMLGQGLLWFFIIIPAMISLFCHIGSLTTYRQNVFSYCTARGFQNLFLRISGIIFPVLVLFFFFFKMGPGTMGLQWDYQYVQNLMSTLPLTLSLLGLLLMVLFTSAGQIWNFFIDYGVTVSPLSQRVVLRTVYGISTSIFVFFVALALRFSFSLGL
jgi:hypothetical protein